MNKYALVIGSETGLLAGANRDAERMRDCLEEFGFGATNIDLRTGPKATREGILDGYAELTGKAEDADVAVVYYSGHGSLEDIPSGVQTSGPFSRRIYQCIVPFDYDESTERAFRGILAEELSVSLYKLLQKTKNVAVILDCCHSALMSRDMRLVPKAVSQPMRLGIEKRIEELLSKEKREVLDVALRPEGSDAVRLVACRQEQSAFEHQGRDGLPCGIFTEGLLVALKEAKGQTQRVSFRDIGERAAQYVLSRMPSQLPGVEGRADRLLFDTKEIPRFDAAPIVRTPECWVLRRGRVFGVQVGDVYSIRPSTPKGDEELGRARVLSVGATESEVFVEAKSGVSIPEGARGVQVEWAEPPRLVYVPEGGEQREKIVEIIRKNPRLAVTGSEENTGGAIVATVFVKDGLLHVVNTEQLPRLAPSAVTPAALDRLSGALERLLKARSLRELQGDGIPDVMPEDLLIEWGLVVGGDPSPLPLSGVVIGLGDRIYFRVKNKSSRDLYVHIVDIGIDDEIAILTGITYPKGIYLEPGAEQYVRRDRKTGKLLGYDFTWPDDVPREDALRTEEVLVVATSSPVDLTGLEQHAAARGALPRDTHKLRQMMSQRMRGTTRNFESFEEPSEDGVLTRRFTFSTSPSQVQRGTAQFLVDEQRPALDVLVQPRGRRAAPPKIAVELHDLVVHDNHALFGGADIRVDALFLSPGGGKKGAEPYHAGTMRFANIKDGQSLSLDQVLVYMGPVKDFLQVCFWVSRDVSGELELSEMLKSAANAQNVQSAMTTLAALAVAAPQAALAVGAVGAAATLVDVSYKLLTKALGKTIGVYRTTLLEADGFRVGRHPKDGHIRAQGFSFSFGVRVVP